MSADQLVVSDARVPSEPQVSATQAAPKPLISRAKQAKAHTQKHARTAPTVDLDSAAHDEAPASAATDLEGLMAPTAGDAQASADSDMAGLSEALRGALGTGASSGEGSGMRAAGGVVGRKPGLLAVRNPCSGFFPASAQADHGQVQVSVHVDAAGRVQVSHVLNESPNGQAFGEAARACAAALRFEPARDGLGAPIDGDAKLELRFSRS